MSEDTVEQHLFTRRALVLAGLQGAGLAILLGRLTYVQLIQGDKYQTLAEENRISTRFIPPPRGQIIDRFGMVIADNTVNYQALLTAEQSNDIEALLTRFTQLIPLSEDEQKRLRRDLRRHTAFTPVLLKDHLSWDEVSKLELHLHELTGVQIETGVIRHYPFAGATAHVLGYVGPVSEREQSQAGSAERILRVPGYLIGKGGVERQHEMSLRGKLGNQQREVNAHGRIVRELANVPPVSGDPLTLTLDGTLQNMVQARLTTEKSAAAVVLDVHTGAVYALACQPTFDPNDFALGIDAKLWRSLLSDETAPLTNKVVSGQYAPGSTFKMLVALAALEAGVIKPDYRVHCPGHMDLGNHRFHCWKRGGHGAVDMHDAIKQSCDTYFYDISRKVGIEKMHDMAVRLGLGAKLNIDLPGERSGLMPNAAWKRSKLRQPWQHGETLIAAIGQGYVLATPLQLAIMTARLVNGGKAVLPHMLPREQPNFPDLGLNQKHLAMVISSMDAVVNEPGGTALGSKVPPEQEAMAYGGKTGTSQVRRITRAERATGVIPNELRPWKERDHALFVGYAPLNNPRFACAVIVEHGGGGSKVAAPIARDILVEAQRRITT